MRLNTSHAVESSDETKNVGSSPELCSERDEKPSVRFVLLCDGWSMRERSPVEGVPIPLLSKSQDPSCLLYSPWLGCPSLTGTSGLSAYQNSALATSGDRRSGRRRIEILPEARQEDRTRCRLPPIPHPVNLRYTALRAPAFVVPKRILPEPSTHHLWVLPSALKQPNGT